MLRSLHVGAFAFIWLLHMGSADADVQDWQVNEVLTHVGGDTGIRYIELRNDVGGCFFPSTRIEAFNADGSLAGATTPFVVTSCFGPNTYFLLATPAAVAQFSTVGDRLVVPPLPVASGQVCFTSSTTRYDCVRWGSVTMAKTDLFGSTDITSVPAHPDANALTRIDTTHVVSTDWQADNPTPRGPNDGTPWFPPDAGPTPDASPTFDAMPMPDAEPTPDALRLPDAGPRLDASPNRFLDLTPRGGAACSCHGGKSGHGAAWLIVAAILIACGRRRASGGRS